MKTYLIITTILYFVVLFSFRADYKEIKQKYDELNYKVKKNKENTEEKLLCKKKEIEVTFLYRGRIYYDENGNINHYDGARMVSKEKLITGDVVKVKYGGYYKIKSIEQVGDEFITYMVEDI